MYFTAIVVDYNDITNELIVVSKYINSLIFNYNIRNYVLRFL